MKKFNNWLNVRINEAEEPSYIPMLQQKIKLMGALLNDLNPDGKYGMVRNELGEEIVNKIVDKLKDKVERYVGMVSEMMKNVHGAS